MIPPMMRSVIIFAAALAVAGCHQPGEQAKDPDMGFAQSLRIWTDHETGCRYLIYRDGMSTTATGGITIRFRADGSADCPGKP